MDEPTERQLLHTFVENLPADILGRRNPERFGEIADGLRFDVEERDLQVAPAAVHAALAAVASYGNVIEHHPTAVSVMAKAGWFGASRVILTATHVDSGASPATVHIRVAALEGKLSLHKAKKTVQAISELIGAISQAGPMH